MSASTLTDEQKTICASAPALLDLLGDEDIFSSAVDYDGGKNLRESLVECIRELDAEATKWVIAENAAANRAVRAEHQLDEVLAANRHLYAALEKAAEIIRDRDGGNQADETGWADPDMMDAWVSAQTALRKARGDA